MLARIRDSCSTMIGQQKSGSGRQEDLEKVKRFLDEMRRKRVEEERRKAERRKEAIRMLRPDYQRIAVDTMENL